jgi:hypothetical protein
VAELEKAPALLQPKLANPPTTNSSAPEPKTGADNANVNGADPQKAYLNAAAAATDSIQKDTAAGTISSSDSSTTATAASTSSAADDSVAAPAAAADAHAGSDTPTNDAPSAPAKGSRKYTPSGEMTTIGDYNTVPELKIQGGGLPAALTARVGKYIHYKDEKTKKDKYGAIAGIFWKKSDKKRLAVLAAPYKSSIRPVPCSAIVDIASAPFAEEPLHMLTDSDLATKFHKYCEKKAAAAPQKKGGIRKRKSSTSAAAAATDTIATTATGDGHPSKPKRRYPSRTKTDSPVKAPSTAKSKGPKSPKNKGAKKIGAAAAGDESDTLAPTVTSDASPAEVAAKTAAATAAALASDKEGRDRKSRSRSRSHSPHHDRHHRHRHRRHGAGSSSHSRSRSRSPTKRDGHHKLHLSTDTVKCTPALTMPLAAPSDAKADAKDEELFQLRVALLRHAGAVGAKIDNETKYSSQAVKDRVNAIRHIL